MQLVLPTFPDSLDADLTELCAAAEPWVRLLRVTDQRVQAAPDARTVRYYQTIGLLDRPVRYDGRTARYGSRHLLQLVAVRALQSNGLSLAQVQAMLAGATNADLRQVVASALGEPPDPPVAPLAPGPTPATSVFVAVELAPGVVVTIDTRIHSEVHSDVAHTIAVLRRALTAAPDASTSAASTDAVSLDHSSTDAPQGELS